MGLLSRQKDIEILNKEFEDLFQFCRKKNLCKNEIEFALHALHKKEKIHFWRNLVIFCIAFASIWLLCAYVDFVDWNVSALGRILLIKLLPFWDWTKLYNAKCLIKYESPNQQSTPETSYSRRDESAEVDCILCEFFDAIDVVSNASYVFLQRNYLERGLPVLINDSHQPQKYTDFVKAISEEEDFVETDPCDVETSFMLSRLVSIDDILHHIQENENTSFYFHLRNCNFKSVKASRNFIPKLHYYPLHMEPYYSSWLLVSADFIVPNRELYVEGLIMVQQINGNLRVKLTPKPPCQEICETHEVWIHEGEAMMFSTDLWSFSYSVQEFGTSITTITETEWN